MSENTEKFISEYVKLCEKYKLQLWSGEPWYGLEVIPLGDFTEEKIRNNIYTTCTEQ